MHGNSGPKHGQRIASWIYRHPNQPNYLRVDKYVTRDGDKRFRQHHWNGKRWVYGVKDTYAAIKIPYRLLELLAAPVAEPVWICEGENDADNVAALGLIATTNPGGAKNWQGELAQWFKSKELAYIVEDNDAAGREHTRKIQAALHGIMPRIAVISFPELPDHGDVSDWLEAGGNKKLLLARAQQALKRSRRNDFSLEILLAAKVKIEAIDWLWPGRFALGKLGILAGLPDEGKSSLLCYIAARLTNPKLAWPNDEGCASKHGTVILLTCEDSPADTLVPRLAAADADLDRIKIIQMVHDRDVKDGRERRRMFSLAEDLDLLRREIEQLGDVVALLIDPVTAYLGTGKNGVDSFRDTDVRAVLGPLVQLAVDYRIAIIAIMHFNKKIDVTNALLRISNSLAFGGVARHVFAITKDTANSRRLMSRAKNNIASEENNQTLAFHFATKHVGNDWRDGRPIEAPFITFEPGYVDITATEALSAVSENKTPGVLEDAKDFLRGMLVAAGGRAPKADIEEAADAEKISIATLRRAKTKLKIRAEKDRSDPKGKWYWVLPEDAGEF